MLCWPISFFYFILILSSAIYVNILGTPDTRANTRAEQSIGLGIVVYLQIF